MKSLVVIIKSVFVPIYAFLFLAIGILACCFSGVVEYNVLKELLLMPEGTESVINAQFWPVVLVMVLEGSKFTLHFYHAALKRKRVKDSLQGEENSKNLERTVKWVKNALVVVSFVCTIIFITNVFFGDNGKSEIAAREEVGARCDKQLEDIEENLETQVSEKEQDARESLADEERRIDDLYDQLKQIQEKISLSNSKNIRQDLQEETEALREQIEIKEAAYNEKLQKKYDDINNWYLAELAEAEEKYGLDGTERKVAESDFETEAMGDNPYLYTFLRAITRTFYQEGYSRMTYFWCVIFLSMAISALLEACISISQHLLTLKVETFYEILGEIPITETEHVIAKRVAWLLFSIICLLAVYIVTGLCMDISVSRIQIVMAGMSYVVTLLFADFSSVVGRKREAQTFESGFPLWKKIMEVLPDTLISGMIAFAGYVLLGFLVDGNFVYGDLNSLAIALGGMMAQFFRKRKYIPKVGTE